LFFFFCKGTKTGRPAQRLNNFPCSEVARLPNLRKLNIPVYRCHLPLACQGVYNSKAFRALSPRAPRHGESERKACLPRAGKPPTSPPVDGKGLVLRWPHVSPFGPTGRRPFPARFAEAARSRGRKASGQRTPSHLTVSKQNALEPTVPLFGGPFGPARRMPALPLSPRHLPPPPCESCGGEGFVKKKKASCRPGTPSPLVRVDDENPNFWRCRLVPFPRCSGLVFGTISRPAPWANSKKKKKRRNKRSARHLGSSNKKNAGPPDSASSLYWGLPRHETGSDSPLAKTASANETPAQKKKHRTLPAPAHPCFFVLSTGHSVEHRPEPPPPSPTLGKPIFEERARTELFVS